MASGKTVHVCKSTRNAERSASLNKADSVGTSITACPSRTGVKAKTRKITRYLRLNMPGPEFELTLPRLPRNYCRSVYFGCTQPDTASPHHIRPGQHHKKRGCECSCLQEPNPQYLVQIQTRLRVGTSSLGLPYRRLYSNRARSFHSSCTWWPRYRSTSPSLNTPSKRSQTQRTNPSRAQKQPPRPCSASAPGLV